MSKPREPGWYFVKPFEKDFDFEVAFWNDFPPCWECVGTNTHYQDSDFTEIDERRITREEPIAAKIAGTTERIAQNE